ncbi:MAG: hypothetical protein A2X18_02795 [Bacteroidetes bacterium GWF2_40_14]|nr:MAG: hypothetical protein A2X18_02795 [Bacteroidetes bacterium GWF2_40_14]
MKITHKFLNINKTNNPFNWDQDFYSENAILKSTKIETPEIMILGTFNPNLSTNPADIFYGRNFFWTAFKNLFCYNKIVIYGERLEYCPYDPSLKEIFTIIRKLNLTFSDLIASIFDNYDKNAITVRGGKEYVQFNNTEYNPIKDGDLAKLNRLKKINWNTQNIISYLNENKKLRKIYLTRQANQCWAEQTSLIKQAIPEIQIIPIYTPSAQGGAVHQQTGIYNNGKMTPLLSHWVHNNEGNFGNLNHNNWLTNNDVNIYNF